MTTNVEGTVIERLGPGQAAGASEFDTYESLVRVYGEGVVLSMVGRFTLVHLDNPTDEEISRRCAEFRPDDFFFDNCPLCESAKASGGHIVFDGDGTDDTLDRYEQVTGKVFSAFNRLNALLTEGWETGTPLTDLTNERYRAVVDAMKGVAYYVVDGEQWDEMGEETVQILVGEIFEMCEALGTAQPVLNEMNDIANDLNQFFGQ